MTALIGILAQAAEEGSDKKDLYPQLQELIVGFIAFTLLFVFMAKWVLPRLNTILEERRKRIQGELEKAERTRENADQLLTQYRGQLSQAREESNRIIEEARRTADGMRRELLDKAEEESQQVVARARDEIRAERDRAFAELKRHVGELSVELATRVVGESLDRERQLRLVDEYIDEVAGMGNGNGKGRSGDGEGSGGDRT